MKNEDILMLSELKRAYYKKADIEKECEDLTRFYILEVKKDASEIAFFYVLTLVLLTTLFFTFFFLFNFFVCFVFAMASSIFTLAEIKTNRFTTRCISSKMEEFPNKYPYYFKLNYGMIEIIPKAKDEYKDIVEKYMQKTEGSVDTKKDIS